MTTGGADLIFAGGSVFTADASRPRAEAVAVAGGRVVAIGDREDVLALKRASTEVVDLAGRTLLPGFQDAHVHASGGGLERSRCDLSDAHSLQEYLEIIARYAASHPGVEWITGGGWAMDVFPGGVARKDDLDRVAGGRPVFLSNRDHHGAWVNTAALERAGIRAGTPDPDDGRIERDEQGEPCGTLQEGAMGLVERILPRTSAADMEAGLLEGQRYLHSLGITGWQEAIVGDYPVTPDCFDAYVSLDRAGKLTGRVVGALWWERGTGAGQLDQLLSRREEASSRRRFSATAVKFMQDGVCENFTAAMLTPYLDRDGHGTGNCGTSFFDAEELKHFVTLIDREGFQGHFHAIGDRAVREVLDAIEAARAANGPSDNRHCLAHIQVVHPEDVPRFAALGAIANAQPLWACSEPQMTELTLPFIGPERAAMQYPFASLLRSGARLCFGSDWPVSTPNPLSELHVAVNRTVPPDYAYGGEDGGADPLLPDERLDLETALLAFTIGSAYLNHAESETGSISVGKLADFALLDQNLFEVPSDEIGLVGVDVTFVEGVAVYERGAAVGEVT